MTMRRVLLTSFLVSLFLVTTAGTLFATSFSVLIGGASTLPPDTIYTPGPTSFLAGIGTIEVNAFSYGYVGISHESVAALQFSVDPFSIGAPLTAVATEAASSEAEADIFASASAGSNILLFDGDGITAPPLGLVEPTDDVDGYDTSLGPQYGFIWWSVDPPSAPAFTVTPIGPADIVVDPVPSPVPYTLPTVPKIVFAPAVALGLGTADDIDALVILEDGTTVGGPISAGDCVLFSLAPGSAALSTIPASPGDVLASGPGCPTSPTGASAPWVFATGPSLGLLPGDNIDALDIYDDPTALELLAAQALPAAPPAYLPWLAVLPLAMLSGVVIWRYHRRQQLEIYKR